RCKTKSPFEVAVSAVRALGATLDVPDSSAPFGRLQLVADGASSLGRGKGFRAARARRYDGTLPQEIAAMGEPMYMHQAPNGYPEDSKEWISSGSLISRLNFAMALAHGKVFGVEIPSDAQSDANPGADDTAAADSGQLVDQIAGNMLGIPLEPGTRAAILKTIDQPVNTAEVAALILGSPDFQQR
ncbi:MAG TPA: DUF1800 family protein, partial [Chthonomonadales bacterium]|nr:DUF1800 family protein [Chthonomonadales bacterium]